MTAIVKKAGTASETRSHRICGRTRASYGVRTNALLHEAGARGTAAACGISGCWGWQPSGRRRTLTMFPIIMVPTTIRAGPTAYGGMDAAGHKETCSGQRSGPPGAAVPQPARRHSMQHAMGALRSDGVHRYRDENIPLHTEDGVEEQADEEEAADGEAGHASAAALPDACATAHTQGLTHTAIRVIRRARRLELEGR